MKSVELSLNKLQVNNKFWTGNLNWKKKPTKYREGVRVQYVEHLKDAHNMHIFYILEAQTSLVCDIKEKQIQRKYW